MSRQATAWKHRMVMRLYQFEATAQSPQERQHWHFCRELLRRALEGWRDPWVAAHYYTYGLHPLKYRLAIAKNEARQLWELHQSRAQAETRHTPQQVGTYLEQDTACQHNQGSDSRATTSHLPERAA